MTVHVYFLSPSKHSDENYVEHLHYVQSVQQKSSAENFRSVKLEVM